ncbi:hypothetical protein AB0N09_42630 [Streptomyces erythrochromogenes]|uniref:hypothetical protein n=1 Tax=Streptomyces erythrochromogenes TaxID=285574 RepID=UPI0034222CE6
MKNPSFFNFAPMPERPAKAPRDRALTAADVVLFALGLGGALLSGWSLTTLMMDAGAPWWVAGLALTVLDGVALLAGVMVHHRRHAPHTAAGAQLVLMLAVLASATVNAAHGAVMENGGWMAAVVLGAAPIAWEVGFALRHRALTVLIWCWWHREARTALRREAWERIAPIAAPPTVTIEREHQAVPVPAVPERGDAVAELEALRAELAVLRAERPALTAEAVPVTAAVDAEERTAEALALYRAVMATPGATADDRAWAADVAIDAGRRDGGARPADGPSLVKGAAEAAPAPGGESADRVPEQRPPSIAAGVAELRAAGIEDPAVMTARLSALRGEPVSLASVKRAARAQRAAEREAAEKAAVVPETGQYL